MPDAILFLVSQPYLSARRFRQLQAGLCAAAHMPCRVVRMEGAGQSAMEALDDLVGEGARDILVQPVGLPFSDSLMAWLPGALGYWQRESAVAGLSVRLASDQIDDGDVLRVIAEKAIARAESARPVDVETGSIEGKGWDDVPAYRDHLLVCTGPRCTYRRSGLLRDVLNAELSRQGVMRSTLVATTGCLFPCNGGPVVAHYPAGRWYRLDTQADVAAFVTTVLVERRPLSHLIIHEVQTHDYA
ncbi:(2Fe-2S) ferredoxin domain-containing protein [Pelagibacterium sediminicola]|uniref:(2Fe-2S) ferredoxin domain-containing protein n=1 Tax=Pelagibacterium sediminicola TaxID=2248761 RepID=UPI000E320763|nr:(2Fe-2S) ferredoxin domain-containing protein [Pelagibacterium sediminicola]